MIECKNCKSMSNTKNSKVRQKQRYKCKEYGYNVVIVNVYTDKRRVAKKAIVIILYSLGQGTYNMLGKIFGVSRTTIYNWIVKVANNLDEIEVCDMVNEIEVDEMWHHIGAKRTNCGLSKQLTEEQREQLQRLLVNAIQKHSEESMIK